MAPISEDDEFGLRERRMRVATLIRLRWLAVVGQSSAVLVTRFALRLEIPFVWCLACVALAAALNLWLRWRFPVGQRLGDASAGNILAFDVLQLAALLALTGGLVNPFSILFLAPVMISAATLSPRRTVFLLGLTLACASALSLWYVPLPWPPGQDLRLPALYGVGVWSAISVSAIFITIYAYRVAQEARDLAGALSATELVLAREQHLTQLDGLAAAAAHELGTPLATVALVVNEMARQEAPTSAFAEDLRLLEQEVGRCRTILGKLTSLQETGGSPLEELSLSLLLEEVAAPHRHFGVALDIEASLEAPDPICRRSPGMIYGLGNIVENAVDFAASRVTIKASATSAMIRVTVSDDGPGFASNILARLGEPYVTTRAAKGGARDESSGGMGLGLFIAKTLLERSGASLEIRNQPPPGRGARATISWPRETFERDRRSSPDRRSMISP